jgi:uncharacterized cysteine cluster protein YcgN (CxxCxxCC family)
MPIQMKDAPSSLCDTCRHAIITRALGQNEREIRCRMLSDRRVAPMAECSDYRERTAVSLHDMSEMAWRVRTLPNGTVEILHPDEIEPRKKYVRVPGFLAPYDDD